MQSTIQIILIICVVSLTAIFVTAGVWVILILREFRKAAQKVSKVGDDVEETSQFVKQKIKDGFSMMALMATLSTLWSKREEVGDILPEIKDKLAKGQKQNDENKKEKSKKEENKEEKEQKDKTKKKKRKFFFRKKN